jgi:predicted alpha/beta-fold hydrolase
VGLVGFSLGGNITLKYLGDLGSAVDPCVDRAVAFSVPCDLASSSARLESRANRLYMDRFLVGLRGKIRQKIARFPGQLNDIGLDAMRTFREFDGAYTAPLHGYLDAEDYWARASSKPVLTRIAIPTLLVNARNDPFLPEPCFPEEAARASEHFHLEVPASGGHIGFVTFGAPHGEYWSEARAVEFLG